MYAHRFYSPEQMRWITRDPLGFTEGLNLYRYTKNNPYVFTDPNGTIAFMLPFVMAAFGLVGLSITGPTLTMLAGAAIGSATGYVIYETNKWYETNCLLSSITELEDAPKKEKKKRENNTKGGPPRHPVDRKKNNVMRPPVTIA